MHPLAQAATEPAIGFDAADGRRWGVDEFLANNRTMGLLILQGEPYPGRNFVLLLREAIGF